MARVVTVLLLCVVFQASVGDYAEFEAFIKQQANNVTFVRLFEDHLKKFQVDETEQDTEFPCKPYPRPSVTTTSVHRLRPADIKVVAALGDSITAGTGIKAITPLGLLWENRGLSWSVGGYGSLQKYETVPNILKVYDPSITGFATGGGPWFLPGAHLNLAVPGAKAEDMPTQAERLVHRMKSDKNIDFQNDWKLITLFIGGNDLCAYCKDEEKYSPENYVAPIKEALDYLHANIPRAFVNLVDILDISTLKDMNGGIICQILHFFLCKCGAYPASAEATEALRMAAQKYRESTRNLAASGRYDTRDDFTVVAQPFFSDTTPPRTESGEPDYSYFAPDCFHLSQKGHVAAAEGLWNNMVEPVGKKRTKWSPREPVDCPSAQNPYLYTYKNSEESFGLGETRENLKEQTLSDKPSQSSSQSGSAVVGVSMAMACLVAIVIAGIVVWRLHRNRPGYREVTVSKVSMKYDAI